MSAHAAAWQDKTVTQRRDNSRPTDYACTSVVCFKWKIKDKEIKITVSICQSYSWWYIAVYRWTWLSSTGDWTRPTLWTCLASVQQRCLPASVDLFQHEAQYQLMSTCRPPPMSTSTQPRTSLFTVIRPYTVSPLLTWCVLTLSATVMTSLIWTHFCELSDFCRF